MNKLNLVCPVVVAVATGFSAAYADSTARTNKSPSPANDVRYYLDLSGLVGHDDDCILKEFRTGGRVTGATLDVCYSVSGEGYLKDRFVVDLKFDGENFTGSTRSLEGKKQVSVTLRRKEEKASIAPQRREEKVTVTFDGNITLDTAKWDVRSTGNTSFSEAEFKETRLSEDELDQSPIDFTKVSPEAISVRLRREAVTDFLKGLRGGAVQISLSGLRVSCNHLRTGQQSISMAVNPWRAADFVRQMREVPGAVAVGWTSGRFDMERTLRFPAGGWREGANLRKQDISEKLSGVIAKTLSASAASSSWNDETGELRLAFRRPRPAMASLNLTETLDFVAIVAPEKPVAGDRLLLWLSNPTRITRDESIGAKLVLSKDGNRNDEESSSPIDDETVLTALAKEFRAQRWDSRKLSWK